MGRRKKNFGITLGANPSTEKVMEFSDEKPKRKIRVAIDDATGKVDIAQLQTDEIEMLREAIALPVIEEKKEEIPAFGEDEAQSILDVLQPFCVMGATKIYHCPNDIAQRAFTFTELHRRKLTPPMARVINKWAPFFLKQWKDEIGLGLIFFSVLSAQTRTLHTLMDERKKETTKVTPIKKDEAVEAVLATS